MVDLKSYAIAGKAGKKATKQLLRGNFKGFSSNVDACRTITAAESAKSMSPA